jgi:hypothetical protein
MLSYITNLFKPKYTKPDFIWKYMDIEPELVEEIQGVYLKNMPSISEYKSTGLTGQVFERLKDLKVPDVLGQTVCLSALIYSPANMKPMWSHKDAIQNDIGFPDRNKYALNIPLVNCENSLTSFYSDKGATVLDLPGYGGIQSTVNRIKSKTVAIDSYVLDRPIFFNTQVLHAVRNYSDKPRYAISLRFERNPEEWI